MIFFVLTFLFLGASYAVSWWARRQEARGRAVTVLPQLPIAQLQEDAASVAKELGPGSFREEVRVRGRIVCESPLVAELSHTPCVSYRFSVTREYEEVLWEADAEGKSLQKVQRRSEVVASHEASVPFHIDDGTGRLLVHPEEARIERVSSHSSFQPAAPHMPRVGSFSLPAVAGGTLGYRYEEWCLPLDQEVTIVAEAGDEGGQLALRVPEDRNVPFLVTGKTVRELAQSHRIAAAVLKGTSIGLAVIAVLIFLLGVIR